MNEQCYISLAWLGNEVDVWCHCYITTQLFAASFRKCIFASPIPLNLFRRMNDLCRRKFGLSVELLFPADDSAATSITSLTLRCEVFEEISEYTNAPMCFAVFKPCKNIFKKIYQYNFKLSISNCLKKISETKFEGESI